MIIHQALARAVQGSQNTNAANQAAPAGLQPQQITTTDFMTLLAAQLKGQDPTNPVDPTTFVTQLAQFVELSQVSNIDTLLQNYVQSQSTAAGSSGATGASSSGSSGTGSAQSTGSK